MAFNIDEFRRQMVTPFMKPVASPAYFEAYFTVLPRCMVPPAGKKTLGVDLRALAKEKVMKVNPFTNVRFRVQTADLPQRQFEVAPRMTFGPKRDVVSGFMYSTTMIEVIENDQYDMRDFFDTWMDKIQHAGFISAEKQGETGNRKQSKYFLEFYDNYISEFTIVAFAANGLPQRKWVLKECYPVTVNASNMSWSNTNAYVIASVELTYREWDVKELNLTDILKDPAYASIAAAGLVNTVSKLI